jgi:hypothetical protein
MAAKSSLGRILLGILSGILGGICCLILAYVVGVVVVAVSLRDLLATLLAAGTVLPLMLIIIGVPVTFVIGVITGGLTGIGAALRNRPFGFLVGALAGAICSVFILSVLVPLIAPPQPGDFVHIVSRLYLSASYGLVLGVITSRLFRWMDG